MGRRVLLLRENRLKPGAERHKEYVKAWALRNAERVKALRKAKYEENRQTNIEKARTWKACNPARVLAGQWLLIVGVRREEANQATA